MKVVYVAGRYKAPTEWEIFRNIMAARSVAMDVWRMGAVALCPHLNTMLFGGYVYPFDPNRDRNVWLEGDMELLRRCDAVVTVYGWESSEGASDEVKLAAKLTIPVFHDTERLREWLNAATGTLGRSGANVEAP